MNLRILRWPAALIAAATLACGTVAVLTAGASGASTPPPWQVAGSQDPNEVGSITLLNAQGDQITSGSVTDDPIAAYAVGSTVIRAGDTKATLYAYLPKSGQAPAAFAGEQLSGSSAYPPAGAPAGVSTTLPVQTGSSGDTTLAGFAAAFPNTDTSSDGYAGIYELRLRTIHPQQVSVPQYDAVDVQVTGNTWTQVYPVPSAPSKTATSTTLTASPSPATTGQTVTLTATESPATAGSVQFRNGSTDLGSAVAVDGSGQATTTTTFSGTGSNSLSAVFTPTDSTHFSGSTGSATEVVNSVPKTSTTTTVTAAPSPATQGQAVTLSATVTPAEAGSVQFEDGSTAIGAPQAVSSGAASTSTSALSVGSHTIKAVFTPSDPSTVTGSTGSTTEVINVVPAASTTTTLALNPSGPVDYGTSVTLSATVAPSSAVGSVQFFDGTAKVGSAVAVSSGTASLSTSTLAAGSRSLTAQFTPTNPANFGASGSSAQSLTVNQVATTTVLGLSQNTIAFNGSVTLTSTVTPSGAAGSVQFFDGSTKIGSPVTVSAGAAATSTSTLAGGGHQLTATFTPTLAGDYSISTSTAQSLTVTALGTTTTLAAVPDTNVLTTSSVVLTATLTPSSAAGTVQFVDGSTPLGNPVTVAAGKAVSHITFPAPAATHSITAAFTPALANDYNASTSAPVSLNVTLPPPGATTTTVSTLPGTPITAGTSVTLKAKVTSSSSSAIVGTVQFAVDGTDVGSPVTVSGGVASTAAGSLALGSHTVSAQFSADPSADLQDSSGSTTLVVITATSTSLGVSSSKPAVGAQDTLTATVAPSAAPGRVVFKDGSTVLSTPITVSNGTATLVATFATAGEHALVALFTPADPAVYGASRTAVVSLDVAALPTTTSGNARGTTASGSTLPTDPSLNPGSAVTVDVSGLTPGETVTVVLHSTPTVLGTIKANSVGVATYTFTVPSGLSGAHTLVFVNSAGDPVGAFAFRVVAATGAGTTATAATAGTTTSTGSATLADTGVDSQLGLSVALGLLIAGGLALVGGRRRVRVGRHHA